LNENFTYNVDELLVRYLLNEVSEEEREAVEQWVQSSETNRRHLEHFTLLWRESKKLESETIADENEAWNRFRQKIHPAVTTATLRPVRKNTNGFMRAAAVLALVIISALTYFLLRNSSSPQNELAQLQSADSTLVAALPDGSMVTLNKQSSLVYNKQFAGNKREVVLNGEAFFSVTPNKLKPFIIKVNDVTVRVVGTSFNIRSVKGRTEVIVETGMVEVMRREEKLVLKATEKAIIADSAIQLIKETISNQLYQHYRTREFVCDNTPLWQLVEVLNETYGANIVIEDAGLKRLPLSATFHQESLDTILDIIGKTFNIQVVKENGRILLRQ
jgi:transmembrane sensor